MTRTSLKNVLIGSGIALLVFGTVPIALGQSTAHDHSSPATPAASQAQPAAPPSMVGKMAATEKKLDDLVAQMNAAKGQAKVDGTAALLTELVAMHKGMCADMMKGHQP